eukprot:scaffold89462_cov42-Prasinocladus_malaysianus.AAC.1
MQPRHHRRGQQTPRGRGYKRDAEQHPGRAALAQGRVIPESPYGRQQFPGVDQGVDGEGSCGNGCQAVELPWDPIRHGHLDEDRRRHDEVEADEPGEAGGLGCGRVGLQELPVDCQPEERHPGVAQADYQGRRGRLLALRTLEVHQQHPHEGRYGLQPAHDVHFVAVDVSSELQVEIRVCKP